MPGPIGLQGGLEHYEPTLPVDRRLLDEVGVFAPEIVILPLASFKSQAVAAGILGREHWTRLGARAGVVIPGSGCDEMAVEMLAEADVIVLPGGVPNRLVGALTGTQILEMIVAKWESGAGITGSSAGAMALFEQRLSLYPPDPFRLIPGFGLLQRFVVAPHFDRLQVRHWFRPFLKRMRGRGVLGIDESTGLVGRDGQMQVLGHGSVTIASDRSIDVFATGSLIDIDLGHPFRSALVDCFQPIGPVALPFLDGVGRGELVMGDGDLDPPVVLRVECDLCRSGPDADAKDFGRGSRPERGLQTGEEIGPVVVIEQHLPDQSGVGRRYS
jgi:cyanophycinase-like exopeptidase